MNKKPRSINSESFVLVTGASSGIGAELAVVFAQNGFGLVLASRSTEKLELLAQRLRNEYNSIVHVICCDLSITGSAERLYNEVKDLGVHADTVVNNAGAGCCGLFHEMDAGRIADMLRLDIEALTFLSRLFAADMAKRGGGRILNVASTGSYQPGPYIAVYYAAKAYVLSLTHAMAEELKGSGISVAALCPGATRTGFAEAAGKADISSAMEPAAVARTAYKGLMKGRRVIIPGVGNKLAVFATKLLPGSINAAMVKRIQKKMVEKYSS